MDDIRRDGVWRITPAPPGIAAVALPDRDHRHAGRVAGGESVISRTPLPSRAPMDGGVRVAAWTSTAEMPPPGLRRLP